MCYITVLVFTVLITEPVHMMEYINLFMIVITFVQIVFGNLQLPTFLCDTGLRYFKTTFDIAQFSSTGEQLRVGVLDTLFGCSKGRHVSLY